MDIEKKLTLKAEAKLREQVAQELAEADPSPDEAKRLLAEAELDKAAAKAAEHRG